MGASSRVDVEGGVALGAGSQVKLGAMNGVALGYGSYVDEENVVSVGNASLKRRISNVARGTAEHDAATIGQLRGTVSSLGGSIDSNGVIPTPAPSSNTAAATSSSCASCATATPISPARWPRG